MDKTALVDHLIDDGKQLVERLGQDGFPVTAAFWLQPAEDGGWLFYVASPQVETAGLSAAYRQLHIIIRKMPQPFWIDPLEVKLIGERNPLTLSVLDIYNRTGGPAASPIVWGGKQLANLTIEGAYLYPLPTNATN
jgi:hypothetical protein